MKRREHVVMVEQVNDEGDAHIRVFAAAAGVFWLQILLLDGGAGASKLREVGAASRHR